MGANDTSRRALTDLDLIDTDEVKKAFVFVKWQVKRFLREFSEYSHLSEELVAEGNLCVCEAASIYDPQMGVASFSGYCYKRIRGRLFRAVKKFNRSGIVGCEKDPLNPLNRVDEVDSFDGELGDYIETLTAIDPGGGFEEWIECLSETERETVRLRYLHNYDTDEIADMHGVSVGAIRCRFKMIRKRMRERLDIVAKVGSAPRYGKTKRKS